MIKAITPCVVLSFIVGLAFGDDDPPISETNIPTRLSPDNWEVAKRYRSLFESVGEEGLAQLQSHENDSIAIQSAWESVAITVPHEQGETPYWPNRAKLQWFLGFLEGRARVQAPAWWREVVVCCRAHHRDNFYPGDPQTVPYGIGCPIDAVIEREGGIVVYRCGNDAMTIPKSFLDNTFVWNISGAFTEDHFFFSAHSDWGYPHRVACVDRETGELVWESEACGCWWGIGMGACTSYISIVPTSDDRVFVFGDGAGFYMHCFDATDGQTLMQFADAY